MQYANGDKYEGNWKNDLISGEDVNYIFQNGDRYTGQALLGHFDGMGRLFIKEQGTFQGMFSKGQFCGEGRFDYLDGSWYNGQWKDSKMNGKGKFQEKDGVTQYDGLFKNGLMHGLGLLIKKDNFKIKGVWKEDQLDHMIVYENL